MANPEVQAPLDGFDRFTVRLYRAGITVAGAAVLSVGVQLVTAQSLWLGWWVMSASVSVAAWNVHLYDKRVRWVLRGLAWLGLLVQLLAPPEVLLWVGRGLLLAALSAIALKEQFCFRVPGLRAVPVLLAVGVIGSWLGATTAGGILLVLAGVILSWLALAKLQMPLHFDIGDPSRYQP